MVIKFNTEPLRRRESYIMATKWTITKQCALNIEWHLKCNRFVEAIKEFRRETGGLLTDSKAVIEYLREMGDWPDTVTIKDETEEELVASTSLPLEARSVESIRELLCEILRHHVGTKEISCGTQACDDCSLSPQSRNDDFLINLVNLPLNKE